MTRRISAFLVWDQDMVRKTWPSLAAGFLHKVDNRINIRPAPVANAIREIAKEDGEDPESPSVVSRAQEVAGGKPKTTRKYLGPVFGHVAQGMSEVVGSPDLDALLLHADTYLQPRWTNGGLHYARRSTNDYWDTEGNYIYGEPHTGNACIGYARLNVEGGQRKMWEQPWTREQVDSRPWVDGVGFEMDIDCLSGRWDEEKQAMLVALRTWSEKVVRTTLTIRNLPAGTYGIYVDGKRRSVADTVDGTPIEVDLLVGKEDVEIVLLRG